MQKKSVFAYYQKSAYSLKIARYVVTFIFILFLLACIFVFGNDITAENIQLIAKYITINEGSHLLYNEEFSISADEDSEILMVSDNLAVVKNNNLSLYDLGGQKLFSFNYSYSIPAVTTDNRNLIVYDIYGKELSLFNTFSRIKKISFDDGLTYCDISEKGIVTVSKEESYRSALTVFNNNYNEIYKWLSSDNYVTSAKLSADGKNVLITTADSHDGSYSCSVMILDTTSDSVDPTYLYSFKDELPVYASYGSDNSELFVVTDSNLYFFDGNLKLKSVYKFNQSKIESYYAHNDLIILTERNNISGNSMLITVFNSGGKELFSHSVLDEISDISIGKDKFFALGSKKVFEFSRQDGSFSLSGSYDLNTKQNSIICDSNDNCYITTISKVKRITFLDNKESE